MMYIVIEIQTAANGTVSTIVNDYSNSAQADSKFFSILASAALSNVPVHAATILTNEGRMVRFESYTHEQPVEE